MDQELELSRALDALNAAPAGVLVLGEDGKAVWANQTMLDYLGLARTEVLGRTETQLLGDLAAAADTENLVSVASPSGEKRWLQRHAPVEAKPAGQILYFSDVTEQRRLLVQLEEKQTDDPLTGLLNQRALMQDLEAQVSRSRRYNNPLSAVVVEVASVQSHVAGVTPVMDQVLLAISYFLRDQLRWVDTIGRTGEQAFTLVLPETSEADAARLVEKIRERFANVTLPEADGIGVEVAARFGVAGWHKGDDVNRLMRRLQESMN